MTLQMTPDEYHQFRTQLEKISGIKLGDGKEYLVASRLRRLLQEMKLLTLTELMDQMATDLTLTESVVDAMTTNETLWFRDEHPYRIFRDKVLPELSTEGRPLKIWSAACSTGQEPYSLAIELEEFSKRQPAYSQAGSRILATDISSSALAQAREGIYPQLAIRRGMSEQHLKAYFHPQEGDCWQIDDRIKQCVEFRTQNLQQSFTTLGTFDVIFCRNVLIYFSADLKMDILMRMHACLRPGGYLVLGASESLNNMTDYYEMVHCSPGIIYRSLEVVG